MLSEAKEAADKLREDAAAEAEEITRKARKEREALEEEKAAMAKAQTWTTSIIRLDVGGHKFTTSLQTLTSVPDTYFASLFSGRFALTPNAEGAYFIDRDGSHFRHVLNFMRAPVEEGYTLSCDLTEGQRGELKAELEFYGLLDRMMPTPPPAPRPYAAQDLIGQSLLQRACVTGTKPALTAAVSQSRHALVFAIGTTTPFLTDEFQDLRFVITDRVVNGWPVWAAVGGNWFMFRSTVDQTWITADYTCSGGGCMFTGTSNEDGVAPTELPSDSTWCSKPIAVLPSQYASAQRLHTLEWVEVPNMRITAVHGLGDDDPAMAEALQKLAALA